MNGDTEREKSFKLVAVEGSAARNFYFMDGRRTRYIALHLSRGHHCFAENNRSAIKKYSETKGDVTDCFIKYGRISA